MGREAVAVCHWRGEVAEVRLHLDSKALSLRGDIRADLLRSGIGEIALCDEGLRLLSDGEPLLMEFAKEDAVRWQKALLKPPPTLAQKLGVSPDARAFILGAYEDAVLAEALADAEANDIADAAQIVALIYDAADLEAAGQFALAHPQMFIWTVYRKGKGAEVGDTVIRAHLRGLGLIDSKSCAVSDVLTATRYRVRA